MRTRKAVVPPKQGQQPRGGAGNSGVVPRPIPQSVRDEINQTPAWWVRLYHQALDSIGAERILNERIETHSWAGEVIAVWEDYAYPDCPCSRCRRICS